ncbi:TraR/DksA family transcriptional regulator [Terrabacter sp. GCM10028922]|uniref:TraR/DksA family transcriptional regulator n=1 Tax=Terrabacter sp. GCM10028922 TaxID=3273428 RepID=UPI003622DF55
MKKAAKKTTAVKKAAKKTTAVKQATPAKKAPAKKAPAKKAPAKKAPAKSSAKKTASPTTTSKKTTSKKTTTVSPRTKKAAVTTSSTAGARASAKKAATKTAAASGSRRATATKTSAGTIAGRLKVKDDESPWSEEEIGEVREVLLEEIEQHRVELKLAEDELDDLLRASGDGSGDDQADAGAKTAEREHEISVAANARASLRQAEHALEQLDAGTYGICENCGNPIGKLRLQARPRATLCMTCQEKQDRH